MGKKKAPTRKQPPKPAGPSASITRFFDKQLTQSTQNGERKPADGANVATVVASGGAAGSSLAANPHGYSAVEEESRHDMFLDNVMLSQDDDHARVVWKAPEVSRLMQAKGGNGAVDMKKFFGRAASSFKGSSANVLRASSTAENLFEELLGKEASVDEPEDKGQPAGDATDPGAKQKPGASSGACQQQAPLLRLLTPPGRGALNQDAAAAAPSGGGASAAPLGGSGREDDTAAETPRAAAAGAAGAPGFSSVGPVHGAAAAAAAAASAAAVPPSCSAPTVNPVSLSHTPMPAMKRAGSAKTPGAKTPGSAQMSTGKRRRAMLEILDQVETLLSQNPSPGPCKTPHQLAGASAAFGTRSRPPLFSTTPGPTPLGSRPPAPAAPPSSSSSGKKKQRPEAASRGHQGRGSPAASSASKGPARTPGAAPFGSSGGATSAASRRLVGAKDNDAAMRLRTMQRAAESVGQMCDELMLESPSPRVGPTVLFDAQPGAAGASEDGADTSNKENVELHHAPAAAPSQARAPLPGGSGRPEEGADAAEEGRGGATAAAAAGVPLPGDRAAIHHVVLEVLRDDGGGKVLRLLNEHTDSEVELHLLDGWADTAALPGDRLNLLADVEVHEGRRVAQVDYSKGLVVLHPDTLLSGTRITSACKCLRQAAIEEIVGGDGGSSDKAVLGTLLHELFQAALGGGSAESLQGSVDDIIRKSTLQLFEVGLDEAAARAALSDAVPGILRWREAFCRAEPAAGSVIGMGPKGAPGHDGLDEQRVAVTEVVDIEESIWSPRFGLKGMIDASVHVTLDDAQQQQQQHHGEDGGGGRGGGGAAGHGWKQQQENNQQQQLPRVFSGAAAPRRSLGARKRVVAPLEFKTGKAYHGHRAQVTLYMLLMSDRYLTDVSTGLLWYMNEDRPQGVQYIHGEVASLIQIRNSLASYVARPTPPGQVPLLPPMIRDPKACGSCFQRTACMLLHRGMEEGTSESAGAGDAFQETAGHVQPRHADFMRRWMALVQAESQSSVRGNPEAWRKSSAERLSSGGGCLGGLHLLGRASELGEGAAQGSATANFDDLEYVFGGCGVLEGGAQGPFAAGDRILLSVEGKHVAAARGVVAAVAPGELTLRLWRPLSKHLVAAYGAPDHHRRHHHQQQGPWRVDADSAMSLSPMLRGNIVQLLANGGPRTARLRELLVDLDPPSSSGLIPEAAEQYLNEHSATLNADQDQAVRKVLRAHDYTVILGMPGTGKTSTICHVVEALVASGMSVLLTAYTNSAVDNMLLRLKAKGRDDFLRIGSRSIIHADLKDNCLGSPRFPTDSVAELRDIAANVSVVGATCLGVGNALLQKRHFDVVIVDEASQITVPASLGALYRAGKFVLVGDHYQLPPLVVDPGAAEGGLSESLLEILTRAHPSATAVLSSQYRMCDPIMALANRLVYSGEMRCGAPAVGEARLTLPGLDDSASSACPGKDCHWLQKVLSPSDPLVFLDTAGAAPEASGGASSSCNPGECEVVAACLRALVAAGMDPGTAAIVSPYRAQVNALAAAVAHGGKSVAGAEVLTIDKSQGRDKSCVLMSLVKSNEKQQPGDLLTDWRRINVAITRAKHKLVLVGCAKTLAGIPFFAEILEAAADGGWLVQLPAGACRPQPASASSN